MDLYDKSAKNANFRIVDNFSIGNQYIVVGVCNVKCYIVAERKVGVFPVSQDADAQSLNY